MSTVEKDTGSIGSTERTDEPGGGLNSDSVEDWVSQQMLDEELRSSLPAGLMIRSESIDGIDDQV